MNRAGVGALYEHRTDHTQVVVVEIHEPTGYVRWRRASGPGWGDRHRNLKCEDFLRVYRLKETGR
ncbi:hypothetical protein A6A29_16625 [Streptomyces sp. TSRI0281]|nr:hypothetical protein A6A29_16625 [Streptomyces sp. TSRI0281]